MGNKSADAFGVGLLLVRKSLGLRLLAAKARNNGLLGDQVGRVKEDLHSNIFHLITKYNDSSKVA